MKPKKMYPPRKPMTPDEEAAETELINGLRNEDEITLGDFYNNYSHVIKSIVRNNGGDVHDAKDIFGRGLRKIITDIKNGDYDPNETPIIGYFKVVCKLLWMKTKYKRKAYEYSWESEDTPVPSKKGRGKSKSKYSTDSQFEPIAHGGNSEFELDNPEFQHDVSARTDEDYENSSEKTLKPFDEDDDQGGNEIIEAINRNISKLDEKCRKIYTLIRSGMEKSEIGKTMGNRNSKSIHETLKRCNEAFKRMIEKDTGMIFKLSSRPMKNDTKLMCMYINHTLDQVAKFDFEKRLSIDKDFAFEFRFFFNTMKAAEKYQDDKLKAKIERIINQEDEKDIKIGSRKPVKSISELITIRAIHHNKEKYISLQDLINEIKIEKSVIKSEGEPIPEYLHLILEKLEGILNEDVNEIAGRFDM